MDSHGQGDSPELGDLSEWTIQDEAYREFVLDGVRGVSSIVRTSFGPDGAEKLVETEASTGEPEVVLTSNSGELFAAIERGDGFNHPISALLVDAVDSMQRSLSDGGTTAAILTEELVARGYELVEQGLHPNVVAVGYAMAAGRAGETLDALAHPIDPDDETALRQVAATAMTAEVGADTRERYADSIARIVSQMTSASDGDFVDTDEVKILGTTDHQTRLVDGVIVQQWPRGAETSDESNAEFDWEPVVSELEDGVGVAVIDAEIDFEETATNLSGDMQSSGVKLQSAEAVERYQHGLERRIETTAREVRSLGVDVLVSQAEVDDAVARTFEDAGVAVLDGVQTPEVDVHRIAATSGATVVSHPDDLAASSVGQVQTVQGSRVGDELWTTFEGGRAGGAATLVVGTGTHTNARRAEQLVSNALDVTAIAATDRQVLPGAGAPMMAVSTALREHARAISGAEQLAVEAFADAVESLVGTLAENAGLDKIDARTSLRTAHAGARTDDHPAPLGLNLRSGATVDAVERGVVEPRRIFSQALETARTTAEHLLTTNAAYHPGVDLFTVSPETEHR